MIRYAPYSRPRPPQPELPRIVPNDNVPASQFEFKFNLPNLNSSVVRETSKDVQKEMYLQQQKQKMVFPFQFSVSTTETTVTTNTNTTTNSLKRSQSDPTSSTSNSNCLNNYLLTLKDNEIKQANEIMKVREKENVKLNADVLRIRTHLKHSRLTNKGLRHQIEQYDRELNLTRSRLKDVEQNFSKVVETGKYKCCICFDENFDIAMKRCGHVFCERCINTHRKTTKDKQMPKKKIECPLCRTCGGTIKLFFK